MVFSVTNMVLFVIIFEKVLGTMVTEPAGANEDISDPKFKRRVKHEYHDDQYEYPRYKYGYSVHDPKTKDIKSAWEHRDGDVTHGEYSLVEPDGAIRIVKYVVDKHHGFRAVVDRIPPPQSSKGEKSSQSFEKFQSYYNSPLPERNYDMFVNNYQKPKANDFHRPNPSQEFQSLRADVGHNKEFNFFSTQQKSQNEDDDDSEEEGEDEDGKDEENEKENLKYNPPVQHDLPKYNYQSQSLQDMSARFRNPAFELNQVPVAQYKNFMNQNDGQFRFEPAQFNFKPSPRDYNGIQDFNARPKFDPGKANPTAKTGSYQSMNYNGPNFIESLSYEPQNGNAPLGPMTNLEPHNINMDMMKHLPYYEDTYYPPQSGNYKFSQPEVEAPAGEVINSLNVPPAHSFPSTSHLLIPAKEKLPDYNERNQNSHLQLPPPGTPISHNHHHTGQFERYD